MMKWQWFLSWLSFFGILAICANWPRRMDALKDFWVVAGVPWPFASWTFEKLDWFNPTALIADTVLSICLAVGAAWICTWSRVRSEAVKPRP